MAKTIQVRDETYRALVKLKERMRAESFDEVVAKLAFKELGIPEDLFGADRGKIKPFSSEDRMEDRPW
ncbi:MAG: antitoxin VapB family protein [Candidatus Methanodesulfokora sp.]|jgi:predicted CopG family antitoxin|nr:MAG: VapB-type antitoxin [Candidatus Korarchaeota archaeon]